MHEPSELMSGSAVELMGTVFSFDLRDPVRRDVFDGVVEELREIEAVFTTYSEASPISRLGRGEIAVEDCPGEVAEVLDFCEVLKHETGGYFDVYASGRLDPSGLVKGWSVQRASRRLKAAGSVRHCVNGGGDIFASDRPTPDAPWRVGIAHPFEPGSLAAVTLAIDEAVATSGLAERGHHVLDPFTGEPATSLMSVTVQGPDLSRADAYATAAIAMGGKALDWLASLEDYEAYVITADGGVWQTTAWPGV